MTLNRGRKYKDQAVAANSQDKAALTHEQCSG